MSDFLIIDNGGEYSSHELIFVECSAEEARTLPKLFACKKLHKFNRYSILGHAGDIKWVEDPCSLSFIEFVMDAFGYFECPSCRTWVGVKEKICNSCGFDIKSHVMETVFNSLKEES